MGKDKKLNEVIRVKKRPRGFVTMDKGFIENESLSWKAKGMLAYLLSKPNDWKVIVGDVIKRATDGKVSVYSGLDELKKQGYYEKNVVRSEDGRRIKRWESIVYELPKAINPNGKPYSLLTDFQDIENQDLGNQDIENREHSNNYIIKINPSDMEYSLSCKSEEQDRPDEAIVSKQGIEALETKLRANISYEELALSYPNDIGLVDELIAIMIDVLITPGGFVEVEREFKPRELVSYRLESLGFEDIEHAILQFKNLKTPITKKKQYLLTVMYNCKLERESHYTNLARSDL
jgi:DNA-binding PadR family transcriptional regulator